MALKAQIQKIADDFSDPDSGIRPDEFVRLAEAIGVKIPPRVAKQLANKRFENIRRDGFYVTLSRGGQTAPSTKSFDKLLPQMSARLAEMDRLENEKVAAHPDNLIDLIASSLLSLRDIHRAVML